MSTKNIFAVVFASTIAISSFTPYQRMIPTNMSQNLTLTSQRKSIDFERAKKGFVKFDKAFKEIPRTTEMWVKVDAGSSERQVLLGNFVANKNCFALELTADQQLRYVEYAYEGTTRVSKADFKTSGAQIATGEWMHLGIIRDVEHNKVTMTKNGEVLLEYQLDGTDINQLKDEVLLDTPHFIGTDARKSFFLEGEVSDVRLWDKTKTISELKSDMDVEIKGNEVGLMHAWSLDSSTLSASSLAIVDKVSSGINGVATNITLPSTPTYQKSGLDFSKNDKDLEMLKPLDSVPMTMETWVKFDVSKAGTRSVIAGNYHLAVYKEIPLMNFEVTAKGEPRMYWINKEVATNYVATGTNVYTGEWTHIAITCSDTKEKSVKNFTTYINGKEVHSEEKAFAPEKLTQPFKIGEDTRKTMYLKGSLADLRLWSSTRTAEEIKANFNQTVDGDSTGLMGNWLFDKAETNGSYTDRSGKNNHVATYWIDEDLFKKKEDGYQSIAVIPDTQWLAALKPANLTKQTTWLKNNAERLGINFAIHVGDIVDSYANDKQWQNAQKSMNVLDGTLPYVFSGGNHDIEVNRVDGVPYGTRNSQQMNKHFPYDKFSQQESFGGAFEKGKMDNTYSYFTVAGVEFMTISLEPFPRDIVLDWANDIVAQNPDKRVLVTTHIYLYYDGKTTTETAEHNLVFNDGANTGQEIWDEFASKHENIVAVISGHVGYSDIIMNEAIGEHGNTVKQILCDAQFMDKDDGQTGSGQGLGMIMLVSFKENSDEVSVNWYSTVRNQFFRQGNQFSSTLALTKNPTLDTSALETAIEEAKELLTSTTYQEAIPSARAAYDQAIDTAVEQLNKATTKEELDQAILELQEASTLLNQKMGDKVQLRTALTTYQSIPLNDYSDSKEKEAFILSLSKADQLLQDENTTQGMIETYLDELQTSLEAMTNEQNRQDLYDVVTSVKTYQQAQFASGWQAFLDARTQAETALKEGANYLSAKENLSTAISGLRKKADISALQTLVDTINSIDLTSYNATLVSELTSLLQEAKLLIEDETLSVDSQSKVEEMVEKLTKKQAEVIASKPDTKPDTKPTIPMTPIEEGTKPKAPNTGDITSLSTTALITLLSGGAVLGILKKRKKHKDILS